MNNIRNIGIFAHVDAGKTTLTEQLLFHAGAIRRPGRVDEGTAHTDSLSIERNRGISIRSQAACLTYKNTIIRIIDTPGHVDFSAEVEHALLAPDAAVVVISAVEGIQPQTEVIFSVLEALGLPMLIFINKIDRAGADTDAVMDELRAFANNPTRMDIGIDHALDALSALDDALLEAAVEGYADESAVNAAMAALCLRREAVPVICGSALKSEGIESVLSAVINFLPPPEQLGDLSAAIYNISRGGDERRAHVRVFGGELRFGQMISGARVNRMSILAPGGYTPADVLGPGDIGRISGVDSLSRGDWIGIKLREDAHVYESTMRSQVVPTDESRLFALKDALSRMCDEQPSLAMRFEPRTRQLWVNICGEIHRQVIEQGLLDEHGVEASLLPPSVLYRETPAAGAEGEIDMFTSPWFARARFRITPGKRGSGVLYRSEVSTDVLYRQHQRDVEKAALESLNEGLYGWPVTDIELTLIYAEALTVKRPGSHFGPVTPLAVFDALKKAGTRLLEPVQEFEARLPAACAQRVLYELTQLRAVTGVSSFEGEDAILSGIIPVATSLYFAQRVRELSGGVGVWRTRPAGYELCPDGFCETVERTTPDPSNHDLFMSFLRGVMRD